MVRQQPGGGAAPGAGSGAAQQQQGWRLDDSDLRIAEEPAALANLEVRSWITCDTMCSGATEGDAQRAAARRGRSACALSCAARRAHTRTKPPGPP